jgi:hypothetical protein
MISKRSALLRKVSNVSGLVEILEEYDREGFMDFVRREANNRNIYGELRMMNLDRANALIYQKLAAKCAPQLIGELSDGFLLPHPICRRAFSNLKMKTPNAMVDNFTGELALDAYFGAAYNPRRYEQEYEPGVKEILASIIRENYAWGQITKSVIDKDDMYSYMLSVVSADDLIAVWGKPTLEYWWKKVPYDKARSFCNEIGRPMDMESEWWDDFVRLLGPKDDPKTKRLPAGREQPQLTSETDTNFTDPYRESSS